MSNVLVAYFSATGNTAKVAEELARLEGADLFEIKPEQPYTAEDLNFNIKDCRANLEMQDENCRPAMVGKVENMDQYDTVFLCYPNWWNTLPMPVLGFIEHYDWNGKRIIPVNTSEGSGAGQSVQKIREVCRGAEVEAPYELIGSQVDSRIEEIRIWAKGKSEA